MWLVFTCSAQTSHTNDDLNLRLICLRGMGCPQSPHSAILCRGGFRQPYPNARVSSALYKRMNEQITNPSLTTHMPSRVQSLRAASVHMSAYASNSGNTMRSNLHAEAELTAGLNRVSQNLTILLENDTWQPPQHRPSEQAADHRHQQSQRRITNRWSERSCHNRYRLDIELMRRLSIDSAQIAKESMRRIWNNKDDFIHS